MTPRALCLLLTLLILSSPTAWSQKRGLPIELEPFSHEQIEKSAVWDFGRQSTLDEHSARRWGVVGAESGGAEEFGILDDLSFSYQGNRLLSISNNSEGEDFYGRVGYGAIAGESAYEWNGQGFMTADSSRGISNIEYNHQGLPTRIEFDNGLYETYAYDAGGSLVENTQPRREFQARSVREYAAGRIFVNGDMLYSYFPGGYFDEEGAPHYLHTDYQGSVVMVTDSAGAIEQRISYYPYGEPHRHPYGQPVLYAGKERLNVTDDYNYGARRHYAPAINWLTPDPLASNYPWASPYSFCAGNPIMNRELDGAEWKILFDENSKPYGFEWVEREKARDKDGKLLPDHYEMAILFSADGASKEYEPEGDKNIGSSKCTVYLSDGEKVEYDACTYPSDTDKYSTVPEGRYEAQKGKHKNYVALRVGDCGTKNFYDNRISLPEPNKAHPDKHYMSGINIHKPGSDNLTGKYIDKDTKEKKPISEGCILIDGNKWDDFISNFKAKVTIGIIIKR